MKARSAPFCSAERAPTQALAGSLYFSEALLLRKMPGCDQGARLMGPLRETGTGQHGSLRIAIGPVAPVRSLDLGRAVPSVAGHRKRAGCAFEDDGAVSCRMTGQSRIGQRDMGRRRLARLQAVDQPAADEGFEGALEGRDMMGQGGWLALRTPMIEFRRRRDIAGVGKQGTPSRLAQPMWSR